LREEPLDRANKALAGKRIVITRAAEQAQELTGALENLGAEVTVLPMVSFAPPAEWEKLDQQLRQLNLFDALLFLSQNAVRYIFDRCGQLGIECEALQSSGRFIGAVGPATAAALEEKGIRVNYVAEKGTGESLARDLSESLSGRHVLLPRSDRGDERVPHALREIGADVTEVIAYQTVEPTRINSAVVARIRRGEVDAIVFASPSAVRNFAHAIGESELPAISKRVSFVAIGPTTASAIRSAGGHVEIKSAEASANGIVRALVDHYAHGAATARRA
jgi:uroporphyrinogen-III synthase